MKVKIIATLLSPTEATYQVESYEWVEEKMQELAEVLGGSVFHIEYKL
jgi:hypothetical protein